MKKLPLFFIPLLMVVCTFALVSCSGSPLERVVRSALVAGDTTQIMYDSICNIVQAHPKKYAKLLTPDGEVNHAELSAFIEELGSHLRPPMHWNTSAYGGSGVGSLTVYFERSGSMVPYDTRRGSGQLKKAVNDLINAMPSGSPVTINIVNDGIYPYQHSIDEFLQDRDIYASTSGVGNASYTDFQKIFNAILEAQRSGNVSVLVSDLIYSPAETGNVSVEKIFNEENSLATRVFKRYKGKSILVHQMLGDYNGKYYPYNEVPFDYNGKRPFYLMVIADTKVMDAMSADPQYRNIVSPHEARNSYRFNQGESVVDVNVVPGWKDNVGRFRVRHGKELTLAGCQGDRQTGIMSFTLAVNLAGLLKDDRFLCDVTNYEVKSINNFELTVRPITASMVTNNNQGYLEGKTHVLTLTGKLDSPKDDVNITLRNDMPTWFAQCSTTDDTNGSAKHFATTTLGLEQLLGGIFEAFGDGNYFNVTIHLQK